MFRLGVVAALRSRALRGATVGIMVTASHNPECDNGAKLVDPHGEMMELSWERCVTAVLNADDDQLEGQLTKIVSDFSIPSDAPSNLIIGYDTRASSVSLHDAASEGATSLGCAVKSLGLVTTPQLHFVVRCTNDPKYGEPSVHGYYDKLTSAFIRLASKTKQPLRYTPALTIDAANGVGARAVHLLSEQLKNILEISVVNDGNGPLNDQCGADYVKISQGAPVGLSLKTLGRYASLDGDADRIVYFFQDADGKFRLLDGDRIATLLGSYIKKLFGEAGLSDVGIALVQTAYANGSSTKYISEKLGINALCVPTGVKHLHHEAQKADVGIYFEANGHGTICFSDTIKNRVSALSSEEAATISDFIDLTNEAVGDALSDMLLVEYVLRTSDTDVSDWLSEYEDLPCRQLKVAVKDRTVIKTANAERTCVAPTGLQEAIDDIVSRFPQARCFVRPSGTEDIVRVYAEAPGETAGVANVDFLANEVSKILSRMLA
ncbi:phosphoacetylglucosamine mutase [Galendromus occidentalis]|uniref:Phosphoacetylglucosamine mutase n=1 Tax=Galendromus occidentalis TaxID=34638 RepID=A0AAJ7WGW5_9ACAR|nr:phosphoacetylglucosamine mutase [Galendromus occidentalis]